MAIMQNMLADMITMASDPTTAGKISNLRDRLSAPTATQPTPTTTQPAPAPINTAATPTAPTASSTPLPEGTKEIAASIIGGALDGQGGINPFAAQDPIQDALERAPQDTEGTSRLSSLMTSLSGGNLQDRTGTTQNLAVEPSQEMKDTSGRRRRGRDPLGQQELVDQVLDATGKTPEPPPEEAPPQEEAAPPPPPPPPDERALTDALGIDPGSAAAGVLGERTMDQVFGSPRLADLFGGIGDVQAEERFRAENQADRSTDIRGAVEGADERTEQKMRAAMTGLDMEEQEHLDSAEDLVDAIYKDGLDKDEYLEQYGDSTDFANEAARNLLENLEGTTQEDIDAMIAEGKFTQEEFDDARGAHQERLRQLHEYVTGIRDAAALPAHQRYQALVDAGLHPDAAQKMVDSGDFSEEAISEAMAFTESRS